MSGVDTDGVLDKCHCGSRAKWVRRYDGRWGVQCWECPETTGFVASQYEAMTAWNKAMREASDEVTEIDRRGVNVTVTAPAWREGE